MEIVKSANGVYEIYDKYVVVRYFEGSNIGVEEAAFAKVLINEKFHKDFGWISDHANSYSVDPILIRYMVEDIASFKCAAWVSHGSSVKAKAMFIPDFIPDHIETEVFDSLSEATKWVESIIE